MNRFNQLFAGTSLFIFAFSLAGCPPAPKSGHREPETVVFIQGNPLELVAGAKMNATSPITAENFEEWNQYKLFNSISFQESPTIKKPKPATSHSLKEKNKSVDEIQAPQDLSIFEIQAKKISDTRMDMNLLNGKLTLNFQINTERRYQLVSAVYEKKFMPATTLHWSESADGKFLSLLILTEEADVGRSLVAIYFARNLEGTINVPKVDEKYVYSAGPGNLQGWKVAKDDSLKIDFCGSDKETYDRASVEMQK